MNDSFFERFHPVENIKNIAIGKNVQKFLENPSEHFLYTGRGPSGEFHLGHYISYKVTIDLQKKYNLPVVFHIADLEKFFTPGKMTNKIPLDVLKKQILSFGFDKNSTFFIEDSSPSRIFQKISIFMKNIKVSMMEKFMGENMSLGRQYCAAIQSTIPYCSEEIIGEDRTCTVICGYDQMVFFRLSEHCFKDRFTILVNDTAPVPSSSTGKSINMFIDTEQQITSKIKELETKSPATLKEHRLHGGSRDCPTLKLFTMLSEDDYEIEKTVEQYTGGTLTSVELKQKITEMVINICKNIRNVQNL